MRSLTSRVIVEREELASVAVAPNTVAQRGTCDAYIVEGGTQSFWLHISKTGTQGKRASLSLPPPSGP